MVSCISLKALIYKSYTIRCTSKFCAFFTITLGIKRETYDIVGCFSSIDQCIIVKSMIFECSRQSYYPTLSSNQNYYERKKNVVLV